MNAANSHLSVGDKWAVYNNPALWSTPGIWKKPGFDVQKFQRRIDRIIGTADGKPIVKLVWAWDVHRFECGEMRKAYRFFTAHFSNGDTCDLSPPRWILEERIEPGQYMPNWEDVRYIRRQVDVREVGRTFRTHDDWGNLLPVPVIGPVYEPVYEVVDAAGPPPPDGLYSFLLTIADHDPDRGCCARAMRDWKNGDRTTMRCWGYYRLPSDEDLQNLRRMKAERDANPYKQSPHEPLTAETLAEIALLEKAWNEDQHQRRKDDAHELWRDHMSVWGHRLVTDDPAVLHHGKFKDAWPQQQFSQSESGLLVPDTSISKG